MNCSFTPKRMRFIVIKLYFFLKSNDELDGLEYNANY